MNYNDLVRELRERKPLIDYQLLDEAADAIENLQNAVDAHSELGNRMSNLNFGLTDLVLQADATVAAAEERMSAMEDAFRRAQRSLTPASSAWVTMRILSAARRLTWIVKPAPTRPAAAGSAGILTSGS